MPDKDRTVVAAHVTRIALRMVAIAAVVCVVPAIGVLPRSIAAQQLSDSDILQRLYHGPKLPSGFYSEPLQETPKQFVSPRWVRTLVGSGEKPVEASAQTEAQALALTKGMMQYEQVPANERVISSKRTTPEFFEFVTSRTSEGCKYINQYRVWRSNYFQPGADKLNTNVTKKTSVSIGHFMGPLDLKTVQRFAELTWWKEFCELNGSAVLQSPQVTENATQILVTFPAGYIEFDGDTTFGGAAKDMAHVQQWTLTLDKKSRLATVTIEQTKELMANDRR